jgi:hypothetical protein
MSDINPFGNNPPDLHSCHYLATHLVGLLRAIDNQSDLFTPQTQPIQSVIFAALPLAIQLSDDLDRLVLQGAST